MKSKSYFIVFILLFSNFLIAWNGHNLIPLEEVKDENWYMQEVDFENSDWETGQKIYEQYGKLYLKYQKLNISYNEYGTISFPITQLFYYYKNNDDFVYMGKVDMQGIYDKDDKLLLAMPENENFIGLASSVVFEDPFSINFFAINPADNNYFITEKYASLYVDYEKNTFTARSFSEITYEALKEDYSYQKEIDYEEFEKKVAALIKFDKSKAYNLANSQKTIWGAEFDKYDKRYDSPFFKPAREGFDANNGLFYIELILNFYEDEKAMAFYNQYGNLYLIYQRFEMSYPQVARNFSFPMSQVLYFYKEHNEYKYLGKITIEGIYDKDDNLVIKMPLYKCYQGIDSRYLFDNPFKIILRYVDELHDMEGFNKFASIDFNFENNMLNATKLLDDEGEILFSKSNAP